MTIQYPPITKRMDAVKDWVCWATGETTVWVDQADGGRVREPNEVWCEIRPTAISKIGVDEIVYKDVDNEAGNAQYPAQGVTYSLRNIDFEIRAKSRSQEHDQSAWNALLTAHLKVYSEYGRNRYFAPYAWSLIDVSDIMNMPQLETHDMRVEDIALFTLSLSTVFVEADATAVGTWIETTEITSDIKDAGGTSLPASIQLDDEVLP
jgi:hypothetical protein